MNTSSKILTLAELDSMTPADMQAVRKALQLIDDGVSQAAGRCDEFKVYGICFFIKAAWESCDEGQATLQTVITYQRRLFKTWDKFSGNLTYPVPHPAYPRHNSSINLIPERMACHAFEVFENRYKGAYGELRNKLCHHMRVQCKLALDMISEYESQNCKEQS